MSRFVDFSLSKRTDELLRPSEKALEKEFTTRENQQLVFKTVLTRVDPNASFRSVIEEMRAVFRSSISSDTLPSVEEMNSSVYRRMARSSLLSKTHQERFVTRVFENGNVPTRFLPRPSMALDRDLDDEARGKFSIEFTR
jgi:hypothetical protein